MWTAFIGKGEGNSEKISIKISPSGGVLEIKRMTGDAMFNIVTGKQIGRAHV